MSMHNWSVEKTRHVVRSLSRIAEHLNQLPASQDEDDQGQLTAQGEFAHALSQALINATVLLAYHAGINWKSVDADLILDRGEQGYRELLGRYNLSDHSFIDSSEGSDKHQELLTAMAGHPQPGWTFASFDVERPLPDRVAWLGMVVDEVRQQVLLKRALEETRYYVENPHGCLLLWGPYGVGKSHLAHAILWECINRGMKPVLLSAVSLQEAHKLSSDPQRQEDLSRLEEADLLVIDNLEVGRKLIWSDITEHVLRARYIKGRPTVLVSLYNRQGLPRWLSEVVIEVPIITGDYRLVGKARIRKTR